MHKVTLLIIFLPLLWTAPGLAGQTGVGSDEDLPQELQDGDYSDEALDSGELPAGLELRRERETVRFSEDMDREELESIGFQFGEIRDQETDTQALVLAMTAGLLVHGIGHLSQGDRRTGYFLLGMQGVSVGLLVAGGLPYALMAGSDPMIGVLSPAVILGTGAFFVSWFLDVFGTVVGPELRLRMLEVQRSRLALTAAYEFFQAPGVPLRHAIAGGLELRLTHVEADLTTRWDVLLDSNYFAASIRGLPLRDPRRRYSFLGAQVQGSRFDYSGLGDFERWSGQGRLVGGLDLGTFFTSFERIGLYSEVGVGYQHFRLAEGAADFGQMHVVVDFGGNLDVTERLTFRAGIFRDRDEILPTLHRLLWVSYLEFRYLTADQGELRLGARFGDGFSLMIGGSLGIL